MSLRFQQTYIPGTPRGFDRTTNLNWSHHSLQHSDCMRMLRLNIRCIKSLDHSRNHWSECFVLCCLEKHSQYQTRFFSPQLRSSQTPQLPHAETTTITCNWKYIGFCYENIQNLIRKHTIPVMSQFTNGETVPQTSRLRFLTAQTFSAFPLGSKLPHRSVLNTSTPRRSLLLSRLIGPP
jgi:hypothetical protein